MLESGAAADRVPIDEVQDPAGGEGAFDPPPNDRQMVPPNVP
jgi:hypothetical protein